MTTDPTSFRLVHTVPGASDVLVEREHTYVTEQGPLGFEIYRPASAAAPSPAVVFVTGLPDPGVAAMLGKPTKDWASYVDWARAVAASGIAAVTYVNRAPSDVHALMRHLRAEAAALGLDPQRIGIWACSGHVPNALAVIAEDRPACAALLYGYMLDLEGATAVADGAKQFYFANPAVSLDALPRDLPMLVVRAGRDQTPGLEATLQRFVAAARGREMMVTLRDLPEAPHAFDLVDDSAETHAAVEDILGFLVRSLR